MTKSEKKWSFNREDENLPSWKERADLCADSIADLHLNHGVFANIADIGCGDLKLKASLEKKSISFTYTGYDLIPSSNDVIRLDIEHDALPEKHTVMALLGVTEYLNDLPTILKKLSRAAEFIILSHSIRPAGTADHQKKARSLGWKNYLTEDELRNILREADLSPLTVKKDSRGKTFLFICRTTYVKAIDSMRGAVILTPYLIPPSLSRKKTANLGDGFILNAIERLAGPIHDCHTYSSRTTPSPSQWNTVRAAPCVILAGANQIHDNYTIWPGLTRETLASTTTRFIPFGVGIHGDPGFNNGLSPVTKEILRLIHERITYSSWRCPHTVDFLRKELPELQNQFLMTGCPVTYDTPLLSNQSFSTKTDHIAVTVTERGDFWERETATLDYVAHEFPRSKRLLVLQQNFHPNTWRSRWTQLWKPSDASPAQALRAYAVQRGFEVIAPASVEHALALYRRMDLHIGSRLHAHLYCLSQAKRSFLIPIDGRSIGIAESLDFPLCTPHILEHAREFDFERVRFRARTHFATMSLFIGSLKS